MLEWPQQENTPHLTALRSCFTQGGYETWQREETATRGSTLANTDGVTCTIKNLCISTPTKRSSAGTTKRDK